MYGAGSALLLSSLHSSGLQLRSTLTSVLLRAGSSPALQEMAVLEL